jgi:N-acetyl-gamma-glutamyl-phosphate reductase common form
MTPSPDRNDSAEQVSALVIGSAGYVGGELLRLLFSHPRVRRVTAHSRSAAGKPIAAVHRHLAPLGGQVFIGGDRQELAQQARDHEVVLIALDHGESSAIMDALWAAGPKLIVDLSADFRVADPALYAAYYGPHPSPALLPAFAYGLADVLGTDLRGARAIAAPGCFATAAQLALYPLRALLASVTPSLFAVTGSSGAGVKPRDTTHHPARAHNLFAYSVLKHRHEAEILQGWRRFTGRADAGARLLAHSGPMVRGIYLTLHACVNEPLPSGAVQAALQAAYADRPLVQITAEPPELTHAIFTSYALIHGAQSRDGREVQVMVAIDNLLKGAAGQAVQSMNLALGWPETCGLAALGAYPC